MLKTLRTSTKWVMITVAVCFVGMMVFAWGMDITGRQSNGAATGGVVGVVNGEKIMYDHFNQVIQNRRESLPKDTRMTLDMERKLNDDAWNQIVMQTLIDQEIKKRKIGYTEKELLSYMLNNPVPGVESVQMFLNPDGSFNREKYRQFLLDPNNQKDPQIAQFLRGVEEQAKSSLPIMKLQQRLAGGILIPDAKVHEQWFQENDLRKIDFVFIPAGQLMNPEQPVSDKDLQAWYDAHKNEFKSEDQRSLDFVFFRLSATPADSAEVMERAKLIVERARKGENFAELANGYSEDPGNTDAQGKAVGGDLGFIGRGRLVKEFEDVAFNLKPGEVSEPFMTRFGCHIVKVDSVRTAAAVIDPADPSKPKAGAKGELEVKVRHILLKVEPSTQTKDNVENAAERFFTQVSAKGANFAAIAKQNNLEVVRTPLFGKDDPYIPYIGGNASLLVGRTFNAKQGDMLPKYEVDAGFFIAKVAEVKPAGVRTLADVRGLVENAVRQQMGAQKAAEIVQRMLGRMQAGKTLQQAVAEDEYKNAAVRTEDVSMGGNVSGLGTRSALVGKAFQIETIGGNTGVVKTDSGAGVAILLGKTPANESLFAGVREQLRKRMQNELQNEVITQYLENLRKTAKIIDNRSKIFQM